MSANRNRVLAVVPVPLNPGFPNGFSPRWHAFISELSRHADVDVVALYNLCDGAPPAAFTPVGLDLRSFSIEDAHALLNGRTAPRPSRFRGYWEHFFGRDRYTLPVACPQSLPPLLDGLSLAIFFLGLTSHLGLDLPAALPCLFVLEEGLERSAIPSRLERNLRNAPAYKHAWKHLTSAAEFGQSRRFYGRLGRRGHIVAINEDEREWFSRSVPADRIAVIPHGVDCEYYRPAADVPTHDIGVFGDLSQRRNFEPARTLFESLESAGDRYRWMFVGRNPHESIQALSSDRVRVTGAVPDLRDYYSKVRLVVVPGEADAATGTKSSVLQAWAMGKAVVTTPAGTRGVPAKSGQNILIGSTQAALRQHIRSLIAQPELRESLGREGRQTVVLLCNLKDQAARFSVLCQQMMASRVPSPSSA